MKYNPKFKILPTRQLSTRGSICQQPWPQNTVINNRQSYSTNIWLTPPQSLTGVLPHKKGREHGGWFRGLRLPCVLYRNDWTSQTFALPFFTTCLMSQFGPSPKLRVEI